MHTFIIAEAGVNHNGSLDLARKLIDKAYEAGADCVKFQTFVSKDIVSRFAAKADYQKQTTDKDESQYDMIKRLELSFRQFQLLADYCTQKGIIFLSTPFDLSSIDFLRSIDMPFWKIPSGDLTNLPYLEKIAQTHKKVVLSTGMSTLDEIEDSLEVLKNNGAGKITLLHCNTEYPTPMQDVNLQAMLTLKQRFGLEVGYSDHTQGIEVPIAAVALGAAIIEKHFTLDRDMEGPDHKASIEPEQLSLMVKSIRNIEIAMGSGAKVPSHSESRNIQIARKSIVAGARIQKGSVFTIENMAVKRPGTGISPMQWHKVLGLRAKRDFEEDELIEI